MSGSRAAAAWAGENLSLPRARPRPSKGRSQAPSALNPTLENSATPRAMTHEPLWSLNSRPDLGCPSSNRRRLTPNGRQKTTDFRTGPRPDPERPPPAGEGGRKPRSREVVSLGVRVSLGSLSPTVDVRGA